MSEHTVLRVQLLHTDSCTPGSTEAAQEALEAALEELGLDLEVEDVLIRSDEESLRYGMVGGPAIMVDGVDVDPAVRDMTPGGLGCRAYMTPEGIKQAPPVSMIVAALSEVLERQAAPSTAGA